MPFFSIILTTFNRMPILKKAIDSVLNQSFGNWELLIIDNHSTDSTDDFLSTIRDKRVKILKIHNNGFYVKSRNLGIKNSQADWLAFIDSDDLWYQHKLQNCYNVISKNNVDLIYHAVNYANKKIFTQKIKEKSKKILSPITKNLLLNGNCIAQSSAVVKKKYLSQVKLFSENKKEFGWEDYDTWIRISQITENFFFINKPLGEIYFGPENIGNLNITRKILINFYFKYKNIAKKIYGIDLNEAWWFKYNQILIYYKLKNYHKIDLNLKNIPKCDIRFYLRFMIFKIISTLYKNIKKKKK